MNKIFLISVLLKITIPDTRINLWGIAKGLKIATYALADSGIVRLF